MSVTFNNSNITVFPDISVTSDAIYIGEDFIIEPTTGPWQNLDNHWWFFNMSTWFFNGTRRRFTRFQFKKPTFFIPLEVYYEYYYYLNVFVSPIVCVLGLCGNGVGMFVVWKDLKRQALSTYYYLLALMGFDIVLLLTGIVIGIGCIIERYNWSMANVLFTHFSFVAGYLDFVVYHSTSVLIIIMSVERLTALMSPFAVKLSIFARFPKRLILTITILTTITMLPFPISYEAYKVTMFNLTYFNIRMKPEFRSFHGKYAIGETVVNLIYPVIVLFLNITLPILYCRVAYQRKRNLPQMSSSAGLHLYKVTILVLTISLMFVLLSIPKLMIQIIAYLDPRYSLNGIFSTTFYFFTMIGDLMSRLNAANDFFIYLCVSKRYRKLLGAMCCKLCYSGSGPLSRFSSLYRSTSHSNTRSTSISQKVKF